MKKNKMMRVASALLVAVLLTTCAISGTFAKYTTSETSYDEARVAKWGVTVEVEVEGAFATEYDADATHNDAQSQAIAKTVISSGSDKLLAPGTDGTLATADISGEPEVAVNVTKEATLELEGWTVDSEFYCPLVITVDGTAVEGLDYDSADDFIAAVEALLNSNVNYAPNTDLDASHNVTWEWAFEGNDDAKDTLLGNQAAAGSASTISFELVITVTQLD